MNNQALAKSAVISALLQIVMVFINFKFPGILGGQLPPIGGTAIGGIGGLLYGMFAGGGATPQNAGGGAAAGAIGGLIGSAASMAMQWGATRMARSWTWRQAIWTFWRRS
jgi:hypothetical protein